MHRAKAELDQLSAPEPLRVELKLLDKAILEASAAGVQREDIEAARSHHQAAEKAQSQRGILRRELKALAVTPPLLAGLSYYKAILKEAQQLDKLELSGLISQGQSVVADRQEMQRREAE
eukprot:2855305-Prymnesium_polylepis.1